MICISISVAELEIDNIDMHRIVDTRGHGNAKDRHYLVYWEDEDAETRKLFDMDSKKFKRPKLEVEYISAEDPDGKTFLVK